MIWKNLVRRLEIRTVSARSGIKIGEGCEGPLFCGAMLSLSGRFRTLLLYNIIMKMSYLPSTFGERISGSIVYQFNQTIFFYMIQCHSI